LSKVEGARPDRKLAGANPRHVEHVFDQADQAVDLAFVALDHGLELVFAERRQVATRKMHATQLGFQDQPVEWRAHLMGDDRHEVIAHAHCSLQLATSQLQLVEEQLLLLPAVFQGLQLAVQRLALAEQVDEYRHLALHSQGFQGLVQKIHRSALIPLEGIVHLAPGGADKDDGNIAGLLHAAHQLGQLESVHARHLHIENGQAELVLEQERQRLVGGLCLIHLAVIALDQGGQGQQVFRQVVDDQQFRGDVA